MAGNKNLNKAAKAKFDEFYTRLEDIENECGHYKKFFRDKTIFCNCDDPYESMFFKYFAMHFNDFGLKKLISSSYAGSLIVLTELNFEGTSNQLENFDRKTDAIKSEMTEFKDWNGDGREDLYDVKYILEHNKKSVQKLSGNSEYTAGDFRSPECIKFLKEADIVVTNPPFSLFREYVKQLIDFDKKFIIIGNKNAITYKEIFPLIMQNKIWIGYTPMSKDILFTVPKKAQKNFIENTKKGSKYRIIDGEFFARSQAVWFTNLDVKKRHEDIPLVFYYKDEPEKYPKYDNYDAIEVSKTVEIPKDYFGVMGVPISFIDQYNPEQFEIVGMCENLDLYGLKTKIYTSEECRERYFELFGKKGTYDLNAAGVINGKKVYQRILIRRKMVD